MLNSAFPHWIYDNSPIPDPFGYGQEAVDFIQALKHPASIEPKGRFQLYDFQERMTRRIYAPRNPDGTRIVRTVFLMLPRGNRKTSIAAAWALLHTIGPEARPAGQAIFAASDREQAGIGFKEAANIVREDRRLEAATRIYDAHNSAKKIIAKQNKAELLAVSSDGAAQHGKTPSFVLVDEIHAWKGRDLWEALKSGMAKVPNTLMIIATTAGRGQENIGFEIYDYARKVATGEIDDPSFLPIIFEAEAGDDWRNEDVWHKVNPGLKHGFPDLGGLRTIANEAEHRPAERFAFQQYHLNIWQSASRDPLFDMTTYDKGYDPHFDLGELEGLPCYLGIDLSRSGDLTAIVGAWKHDDGRITVHPWFYLPSEGLDDKARLEQVPYPRWRDDNLLNVIEGSVIEPDAIADQIINLCGTYDVQEVIFDPSLAGPIMAKLMDHGINVLQLPQTPKNMHGPICDLERVVNGKRIRHDAHPILRNHFESVVVKRATNAGELTTMHKGTPNAAQELAPTENQQKAIDLAKQHDEARKALNQTVQEGLQLAQFEQSISGMSESQQRIELELYRYILDAKRAGLALTDEEIRKAREQITITEKTRVGTQQAVTEAEALRNAQMFFAQSFTSSLSGLLTGTTSLSDAVKNLTNSLIDAVLQAALLGQGPLGALFGGGSGLFGSLFGFADGGFTGRGGKHEPAGIVHKGEYVMSAAATRRIGVRNLEGLHLSAKRGYADGGYVGDAPTLRTPTLKAANSNAVPVQEISISAPITVNGSSGTPEQNTDLANKMAKTMEQSMRGMIGEELRRQTRPGAYLASRTR